MTHKATLPFYLKCILTVKNARNGKPSVARLLMALFIWVQKLISGRMRVMFYTLGTVGMPTRVTVCVTTIVYLALLVARMVIGFVYDDDCPVDTLIPLYMKVPVGGSLFMAALAWLVAFKCLQKRTFCWTLVIVVGIFCFVWQLIGSIWVCPYFSKVQYEDAREDNYCNKHLFRFAQGLIILEWIIYVVAIVAALIIRKCSGKQNTAGL